MKLFKQIDVELIVIKNPINPQPSDFERHIGQSLDDLLRQVFPHGITDNIRFYHNSLWHEVFIERDEQGVDELLACRGRVYAVIKPLGAAVWIPLAIGLLTSAISYFMMPKAPIQNTNNKQPPSPNNALAQRANRQRLGGRVADIFGTIWSVPDLIAPTYSAYINNKEVEFSYMCVGRGYYNVTKAYDDTTPIEQILGATALVFNPDLSVNDAPSYRFGSDFTADEAALSRLIVKRYSSVNGQTLVAPDNYFTGSNNIIFRNPNIIECTASDIDFRTQFMTGSTLLVEKATDLTSGNDIKDASGTAVKYTLNGNYTVADVTQNQIMLTSPEKVATDWAKLNSNTDFTKASDVVLSTEDQTLWQGWFYTDLTEHTDVMVNLKALNGLYILYGDDWKGISLDFVVESELVDSAGTFIPNTNVTKTVRMQSTGYNKYGTNKTKDDLVRQTAAMSFMISNPNMPRGKRLRFRIKRASNTIVVSNATVVQEVKVVDFYGVRSITNYDTPKGVTTVYAKTLATEGAQSVKDRKLRLLVQRYLNNYRIDGGIILSNRADDIIFNIATDKYLANLDKTQVDMPQISSEIDKISQVFGTPLCTEFCYTFDDNNVSAEEMIQTVAKAVFSQAYRFNNKIQLLFERRLPLSVAIFNSHNIIPDSYTEGRSFGVTKDYDGVKVDYIDPIDDAQLTLKTSEGMNNPDSVTLVGVRNKVQAHMHMMRTWNKHQYSYKSCEFTGGDESGIVIRSNRVTVASQYRANVQQGTATDLVTIGNDIVLYTSNPVSIPDGGYVLFIQTVDGNVDAMSISQYGDYAVKLPRLPSGQIAIGADNVVNAVYQIVSNADNEKDAYLVTEKSPSEGLTNKLTCINYTDKYYQNDADLSNGKITL